ncbi:MAG: aralkylamine N-acetyltransferase [Methanolobus sp.]|jgi:GNAT superfamily N-acetyltransferase|uniref:GNAT family N-acetyltransferase n=1 Tax=Methanolobus sp. TaxID=1874737 RepID=UPI0025859BE4|nr:GNAT family N-acetyltransferase [Methanolobus sp.]MDK2832598.1 aralkylamine N-acetyltransferase [Methanolobus sp.]
MANGNSLNQQNIVFADDLEGVDWEEASIVFERAPLGRKKRDPAQLHKAFEASYAVVIALDSGKVVGMCRALCDGQYQAAIYDMVLLPEYQGKGVGKEMLDRLCNKLPVENIILYSVPGKEGFYGKSGFRKMRTAMAKFDSFKSDPENGYL